MHPYKVLFRRNPSLVVFDLENSPETLANMKSVNKKALETGKVFSLKS
jgi:hypothetical protein